MNRKAENDLKAILDDKKSGSTELLFKLNNFLQNNIHDEKNPGDLIDHLRGKFNQFEIIQKYFLQLKRIHKAPQKLDTFFKDFDSKSKISFDRIFENAHPLLIDKHSLVTISNSKTVYEIIKRLAAEQMITVTVCESRPKLEGRTFARNLSKENVKVNLITEAQSVSYLKNSNCVLLGTDTVLKDGTVINKTGSYMLAVLAHHFGKPVYVLVDKEKFRKANSFRVKKENPDEIWKAKHSKMNIINNYFEIIPKELITKIITN